VGGWGWGREAILQKREDDKEFLIMGQLQIAYNSIFVLAALEGGRINFKL
jgi:hypothetical protein